MPAPLKDLYTVQLVDAVASKLQIAWPQFDATGFINSVFDDHWSAMELKQRMAHLSENLYLFLPLPYSEAVDLLISVARHFEGFEYMFFPAFVEAHGLDDFATSINALGEFTSHASSEFAVRPFIKKYPQAMMAQMQRWALSDDEHQRRLASEGCRPRLPWAMALPDFQRDPAPILPILETLKHDNSEYVRRSVANNLNDISKDNPQIVINIAERWLGHDKSTDRLIRHASRSLLKQGYPQVMGLFGYAPPTQLMVKSLQLTEVVEPGGELRFSFELLSDEKPLGKIRVDYAVGFLRKNGSLSHKVFKLSEATVEARSRAYEKTFSFRPITTRRYYPGQQLLTIIVNGVELARQDFCLEA